MKRVLVIGDIISDVYRNCHFKKMCPDAPGVKAIIEGSEDVRAGGAANVALNIVALSPDTQVDLIGSLDTDMAALVKRASANRVNMDFCHLADRMRHGMIRKERIMLDDDMVVRVDNCLRVNSFTRERVTGLLRDYLANHDPDLVVLSDYDGGTVSEDALEILLTMRERLLVDTKMTDLSVFNGTFLVKLNWDERCAVLARDSNPERFFNVMVVTNGSDGAAIIVRFQEGPTRSVSHSLRIKGHPVQAVDVCGCGDTFMAGLVASLLRNDDPFTAAQFANAAAADVVTKPRTAIADRNNTLRLLARTE